MEQDGVVNLANLIKMGPCDDSTCCCIPKKTTVVSIAVINFIGCFLDMLTSRHECPCDDRRNMIDSIKRLLLTLFQISNLLLLLSSLLEMPVLVDAYVWYTLGYVVMGFVVAIYEFVIKTTCDGTLKSLLIFLPEVLFLFVIYRCLPVVDLYRKHLYNKANDPSGPVIP